MNDHRGCVVFTRLDRNSIYRDSEMCQEERFKTTEEAEAFLDGPYARIGGPSRRDVGWLGPIPIIDPSGNAAHKGDELRLKERLSFADTNPEETYDNFFDTFWEDEAVDQIPSVMSDLEEEGEIPGVPSSDQWGPPILTPTHHKMVQQRVRKYRLPQIECYLSEVWDFRTIETDARRRVGHVNPNELKGLRNRLLDAASDLEEAFFKKHPHHTTADVYQFWTSLQVYKHLADYCRKHLWKRYTDGQVEFARRQFCRALGSYAYEIVPLGVYAPGGGGDNRSSVEAPKPPTTDASTVVDQDDRSEESKRASLAGAENTDRSSDALNIESKAKRQRGRPTSIPDERKERAVATSGRRAQAQILYETNYPTPQQVKNVSAILKHYSRKRKSTVE